MITRRRNRVHRPSGAAAATSADDSGPGVGVGGFATRPGEQFVEPAAGAFVDHDVESREGSGQLLESAGSEDGRGDPGSGQQPGEGERCRRDVQLGG